MLRINNKGFCRGILVYAYILIYYFKNQGFLNEGIDPGGIANGTSHRASVSSNRGQARALAIGD
jgi:hypothetical protein